MDVLDNCSLVSNLAIIPPRLGSQSYKENLSFKKGHVIFKSFDSVLFNLDLITVLM